MISYEEKPFGHLNRCRKNVDESHISLTRALSKAGSTGSPTAGSRASARTLASAPSGNRLDVAPRPAASQRRSPSALRPAAHWASQPTEEVTLKKWKARLEEVKLPSLTDGMAVSAEDSVAAQACYCNCQWAEQGCRT